LRNAYNRPAKTIKSHGHSNHQVMKMTITLETIHKEIKQMQSDLYLLKHIMEEEYELSEKTQEKLDRARKTPRSEYISHEHVKRKLLQ
jgi:hypothetical protein